MVSLPKHLKNLWQFTLDIFFPPICLNCRTYLKGPEEKENLLCDVCFSGIKVYSNIFRPDPQFNLIALGSYKTGALRELLHYFKYNGFLAAQVPLKKLMARWLNTNLSLIPVFLPPNSLLVPIPLHRKRFKARGFNQAELVAEILSQHLQLPLEKDLLERTRDTKPQIEMKNAKERRKNVENSITVRERPGWPQYQNVILVDDIYTSGRTIEEAIRVLRRSGVKNIIGFVIAKAG